MICCNAQYFSALNDGSGVERIQWIASLTSYKQPAKSQTEALIAALAQAGADASAVPISDIDHSRMNRELGTEAGAAQSEAVIAFLDAITG